ncbi:MAG: hypothetical protein KDK36_05665 [Leptospiraceae bacterium]|nr:hypothetical protein [Leptospiraceae bacterium]
MKEPKNIIEYLEKEIKKTEENINNFLTWMFSGIDLRQFDESKWEHEIEKDHYGFWKSLYLVIFKKERITKDKN